MISYQTILLLAAAVLGHMCCAHACGDQVLSQTFDQYSGAFKTWTKPMGKEDFPGFIFLKDDSFTSVGEQMFRASNPQGCVGTAECGATFDVELPPMEEATLTYKYKHSEGYVYGKGGKLPGLCAMDCPSGCSTVTADSGFSARVMWRESDLMSYSYYAGMTEDHCGENWYWDQTTTAGQWHTIRMHVKLNTPGQANGQQTVEYDGNVVYAAKDILWAEKPSEHPIQKLTVRSFHGGGSPSWASAQDQFIYFDDISVSRGNCIGEAAPTGGGDPAATTEVAAAPAPTPAENETETESPDPAPAPEDPTPTPAPAPEDDDDEGDGDGDSGDGEEGASEVKGTFSEEDENALVSNPSLGSTPPPGTCAEHWKACEGACCDDSFQCVVKNTKYVQCRPKSDDIPDGWEGTILS